MARESQTELFRHGRVAVTRSWILIDSVQHAVRYVDQTSSAVSEPPRATAMAVLFVCLLLAVVTIFRIVAEDFSRGLGWFILLACAVVILISGYVAFVEKGKYKITVRFKNGETVAVTTETASQASKFQDAIHDALDQLDYHDTDQSKPTVVLASLEPTQLSTLSGTKPKVMRLSDEEDSVE